jgi:hypothetical protein
MTQYLLEYAQEPWSGERENPCGWTGVDFKRCGLEAGHGGLHDFSVMPDEEDVWEE